MRRSVVRAFAVSGFRGHSTERFNELAGLPLIKDEIRITQRCGYVLSETHWSGEKHCPASVTGKVPSVPVDCPPMVAALVI